MNSSKDAGFNIVYFSSIDWNYTKQRPQHIAERLARYAPLLFVNPFGLRSPSIKDFGRVRERFVSNGRLPRNVTLHSPLVYVPFPTIPWANRITGLLSATRIQKWTRNQLAKNTIIWIGVPSPAIYEILKHIPDVKIVYDCMDEWQLIHPRNKLIPMVEQQIASSSKVVFASSSNLHQKMKRWNERSFLLPNGVEFDHFSTDASTSIPAELVGLQGPLIGYVGEIASWFDIDLIHDAALQNLDLTFVLIGAVKTNVEKLTRLKNVLLLGRKDYTVLPSYVKRFDVCLIPFILNALTNSIHPVKVFEYLAAGKPVVSTPLPEIQKLRGIVEIADRTHFAEAVRGALATSIDQQRIMHRQQLARENGWDIRIQNAMEILDFPGFGNIQLVSGP